MVRLRDGIPTFIMHTAYCLRCAKHWQHHPMLTDDLPDHEGFRRYWIHSHGLRFWSPQGPDAPTWAERWYTLTGHIVEFHQGPEHIERDWQGAGRL